MNRFVLVTLFVLLNVTNECYGNGSRPLLKIRIVDKEDEDPKVSATILEKPPGQIGRRAYTVPSRRVYHPPVHADHVVLNPAYTPYLRNGMYHAGTAYTSHELTQSLGSLVNSILSSTNKYPVNKIYIYSRNNPALPYSEPIYHVYQQHGDPEEPFIPSVKIQPSEIVVKPSPAPQYATKLISHSPVAISSVGAGYHQPKVSGYVNNVVTPASADISEQLKDIQKSIKKLAMKPVYPASILKKPTILNEKVRAYASFMKRPEYFLPKYEPDHHTEPPKYYYSTGRQEPHFEIHPIQPSASIQLQYNTPTEPAAQQHTYPTKSLEFTAQDAIRPHSLPLVSSTKIEPKYRVYESGSEDNSYESDTVKSVSALSEQGYNTQDAIRLLESKRYTIPRDCSSRCLERNKKNYDPVCGSDERTYLNEEMLICLSACRKTNTEMDYQGPCN